MNSLKPSVGLALLSTVCAVLVGCASAANAPSASAKLSPTRGHLASGTVRLTQEAQGVRVSGKITGLKPGGEHGFHVHERGDCSSGDGMSAGGHFNPDGSAHGAMHHAMHHAGDLQSLKADASGTAQFDFVASKLSLRDGPANVRGRGLIVHLDPDDFKTQPTGNSGPRIACAVIE
ncbi:MAG: hypothetical protein OHK0048_12650 [Rhodoferax sp.]